MAALRKAHAHGKLHPEPAGADAAGMEFARLTPNDRLTLPPLTLSKLMCRILFVLGRLALAWATFASGGPGPHASPEEQTLTVEVASGRSFRGQLDGRTDNERLWLRCDQGGSSLLRPIRRERVVRVRLDDEAYSAEEFFAAVAIGLRVGESTTVAERRGDLTRSVKNTPEKPVTVPAGLRPAGSHTSATARVRSVAIDAWPANWDNDVEMDGLVVLIQPLDEEGCLVPVRGTVELELTGMRAGSSATRGGPGSLARWVERIAPEDFGYHGVRLRLPFQAVHPEFDLGWEPSGMLRARLGVPGQGVFEASQGTRIRPYSAFRDRLQAISDQRFLPEERTGRGGP